MWLIEGVTVPIVQSGRGEAALEPKPEISALRIRRAQRSDARNLAALIEIAGDGIPNYLWMQMAEPGETSIDVGERRAAREEGGFSYRHATIAEIGEQVVGMILAHRLPDIGDEDWSALNDLPEFLRPFVELEFEVPGSFYINALAVHEQYRSQGIGARLLRKAEGQAIEAGCQQMSVQHFFRNSRAGVFYRRHGFRIRGERVLTPHPAHPYEDRAVLLVRDL
jgi:ribosomal protein S18 acetylase RimI-like enzyme